MDIEKITRQVGLEMNSYNSIYKKVKEDVSRIAKIKTAIDQGKCGSCIEENNMLMQLEAAPKLSLEFLENVMSELGVVETSNYDPNNYFGFMVANCIISEKPGFSKTDGYDVILQLLSNGTQELTFTGPIFDKPLVIFLVTKVSPLLGDS